MKISRQSIVFQLKTLWPDLVDGHRKPSNIHIPRSEYWMPTKKQLETFIERDWQNYLDAFDYDIKRFACTNFSALFRSLIDLHVIALVESHRIKYDDMLEWAVMTAWGSKFNGKVTSHSINLIAMTDGLWFFEPQQSKELWRADAERDQIHMVIL